MQFSVVIATYNRAGSLRECLRAVQGQDHPAHEIIVVDDASTDNTAEMMAKHFQDVQYLRQVVNGGPAKARNRGIHAASGAIIVFTDDDCRPPNNWLEGLAAGFNKYPNAGAIGGIQLPPEDLRNKQLLARYEVFVTRCVYQVGETCVIGTPAPGGTNNLAIPVQVLEEIGGFDSRFPVAAGEDTDLLRRIAAAGYQTVCLPVPVYHYPQYSMSGFYRQQLRRGVGAAFFNHKYGQQRPYLQELARLILIPLLFFINLVRYRQPQYAGLHTLAGFLQTIGRIRSRGSAAETPEYVWQSSASPIKQAYLQGYAEGHTALDIGAGAGFYSGWLVHRGFAVTAMDRNPSANFGRNVVQADLTALPFREPFDTVLCFDVLEHVADEAVALSELRRITKKRLLLSVPNINDRILRRYNLTYKHHVDKTHFREYQHETLRARLVENGFSVVYSSLEGPVQPAVFTEFVRPRWLRPIARLIVAFLFKLRLLENNDLKADIFIVADADPVTFHSS